MKKKIQIIRLLVLVLLLAGAIVLSSMALAQIRQTEEDRVTHLADILDYDGYLVKEVEGYIAVFYRGRGYPAFITNTPVSRLGQVDRDELRRGIAVDTRTELIMLLEDFGS